MGLFRKLLRKAARSANRVIVEKALPRVKAEDLLPYKANEADDALVEVEAQSNGDMKDLYDYSRLPDATDEDFAPDVNDTVLMLAARTGDQHILNMLLDIPGMDINAQNPSNETALLVAEKEGQTQTVLQLLQQQNIDVNLKDKNNGTVLTYAADRNDTEVVSLLLQRHPVDVNSRTTANDTALIVAARKGHVKIVKSLLQHFDIDVNAENEIGETALIGSARAGFTEAVAALLAHPRIQPNAYTVDYHDTALMWAARNNHTTTFLHLLAHPSVDATLVNKDGKTALDLAISEELALILKVYNKRSGSASESRKSLSTAPLSLDKNRRAHAKATHPPDKVMLVETAPATGYDKWRGQLPSPLQTLLAPVSDVYFSHAVTAVACLVLVYLVQRVFGWKKARKSTTDVSTSAEFQYYEDLGDTFVVNSGPAVRREEFNATFSSDQRGPPRRHFTDWTVRERCCPLGPNVSLTAIRNEHLRCLKTGLIECGPHPDACRLACWDNRVDFLEVLYEFQAPWNAETARTAASLGHLEALRFVLERNCPYSEDIVHCAARANSLPVLQYLIEDLILLMPADGSLFGAAFERAHLECLLYLVEIGCPFKGVYSFGGMNIWPMYEQYLENDFFFEFDARFKVCMAVATHHGWEIDDNLLLYVTAHAERLPGCVAYLRNEGWI